VQNDANPSLNPSNSNLTVGQKLAGCYVLNRELLSESAVSVWLAHDEVLGKEVTLHFVPSAIAGDPRGLAELRQEVKKNRQLIHPNILRVYDFVEDGGIAAVSMDRFEGESLGVILKRKGKFTPTEIQPWIQQLASTLDDAHRVQLIHRDLSPSNIFVKPSGGLFVANFGVSRCIRDAMERTRSSGTESLHISYMSPQQVDGEKSTKADDIYGMGVLIAELLTGRTLFEGPDIVPSIRTATPPTLKSLGAESPGAWEGVIAACLAKKPDQRPVSCSAALALLNLNTSEATTASGDGAAVVSVVSGQNRASSAPKETQVSISQSAAANLAGGTSSLAESGVRIGAERRMTFGSVEKAPATQSGAQANDKVQVAKAESENITDSRIVETAIAKGSQFPPVPPSPVGVKKGAPSSNLPSNFPELSRPSSKWPIIGVGLAAGLVAFGIVQKMKPGKEEGVMDAVTSVGSENIPTGEQVVGAVEPLPVPTDTSLPKATAGAPDELPLPVPPETVAKNEPKLPEAAPVEDDSRAVKPQSSQEAGAPKAPDAAEALPPPVAPPVVPKSPKRPLIGGDPIPPSKTPDANVVPDKGASEQPPQSPFVVQIPSVVSIGTEIKLPTIPQLPPKFQIAPDADPQTLEKALAERLQTEEALKKAAGAAEQAQQEIAKVSETAKKVQESLRKTLDERRKANAPLMKENEALIAERKKKEDEAAKTEAQALEARKAADAAKDALEKLMQQSSAKLEATKKAEDEIRQIAQQIAEQATQSELLAKNQTQAASLRQQAGIALLQLEKEKSQISAAVEKAKAGALEAMRAQNKAKISELLSQAQPLEAEIKKSTDALAMLKDLGDAGIAASKPIAEKLAASNAQLKTLKDEIAKLGGANGILPGQPPQKPQNTQPSSEPQAAQQPAGANTLGMRFVQIGDVDFAVHLVTRQDYDVFAGERGLKGGSWRSPGFAQGADHPVVNVTWKEADAFCKWLTEKERKTGYLKAGESYRLPTDAEWSKAVGLPPEKGATPEERDLGVDDVFPWGLAWPPPPGAGNYAGEETDSEVKLQGYRDEFQWTSPVGKFKANSFGLYDMGGNVWQWTSDYFNEAKERRVLRGGSWYNGGVKPSLLASCRYSAKPDVSNDTYGFRIVKAREASKGAAPRAR
jgi:serine/threonine protein kinase/formylglycine-generating enzyme required for sulfatase activity